MTEDQDPQSDPVWWIDRIVDAMRVPPPRRPIVDLVIRSYPSTFTKPAAVVCDDGATYIIKGPPLEPARHVVTRGIFTDQVAGRLGALLRAPVADVRLVDLPYELVVEDERVGHMVPGPVHAAREIENVRESRALKYLDANRERFARLAVLYGWFASGDEQFLYGTEPPHLVHSADHGHFLPVGPHWDRILLAREPNPMPAGYILADCRFLPGQLVHAVSLLRGINDADIAHAVAAPPEGWGIPVADRVAVGMYLSRRRLHLLDAFEGHA